MGTLKHTWRNIYKGLIGAFLIIWLSSNVAVAFQQAPEGQGTSGKTPITQRDYANQDIEMADAWRANGKIYVVVATLASLMGGIALYMALLDRRIGKLEKTLDQR